MPSVLGEIQSLKEDFKLKVILKKSNSTSGNNGSAFNIYPNEKQYRRCRLHLRIDNTHHMIRYIRHRICARRCSFWNTFSDSTEQLCIKQFTNLRGFKRQQIKFVKKNEMNSEINYQRPNMSSQVYI